MFKDDNLCQFTKQQLVHLLTDLVGIEKLNELWQQCGEHQRVYKIRCWDCEGIAKRLKELK